MKNKNKVTQKVDHLKKPCKQSKWHFLLKFFTPFIVFFEFMGQLSENFIEANIRTYKRLLWATLFIGRVVRDSWLKIGRGVLRFFKNIIFSPLLALRTFNKIGKVVIKIVKAVLLALFAILNTPYYLKIFLTHVFYSPFKIRQKRLKSQIHYFSLQLNKLKKHLPKISIEKKTLPSVTFSLSHFLTQSLYALKKHPLRLAFAATSFAFAVFFYWNFIKDLPNPYLLATQNPNATTRIYDRSGELLYKIYSNENRTLLPLQDIPLHVRQATIAIEDKNFYTHKGLSLRGVARAAYHDLILKEGSVTSSLQGGSTITQQLVKNALLTPERTLTRKIKELLLATMVEFLFNKDQILNMYLNQVAYGGPAYGIEEASQTYFGKSAKNLNLAEATLLAGLPASPTTYSVFGNNPHLAKVRQRQVLSRMVDDGYITKEQAAGAEKETLAFAPRSINIKAPHFVMFVKDELAKHYGQAVVERGGLQVYTTLDAKTQELAEKAVEKNIKEISKRFNAKNGAALVTKPSTGEILAMVGSVNFFDQDHDGNVNLTTSPRQPGSSIKPINYSYALEHAGYTPSSILQDTPVAYKNAWETYAPVNYDGKFRGSVTVKQALAMSLNVPAVKVLASYGVDKMIEQGKKLGITTWNEPEKYGLSLTLGSAEVKMVDMAVAYGSFANGGVKKPLLAVKKVTDANGKVLQDIEKSKKLWAKIAAEAYANDPDPTEGGEPIVSRFTAWQLIDILSDNAARAPEFGIASPLLIKNRQVAVKTGTTNDFRDNWTLGFSPDYLVATWVGNNNNEPMFKIASGITGAAPMWHEIMAAITEDKPDSKFPMPEGMIEVEVCATNGLLPCKGCPQTKKAFFVPGTEPKTACYFPNPAECQAKKAAMEAEGKPAEEIVKALANCPLQ